MEYLTEFGQLWRRRMSNRGLAPPERAKAHRLRVETMQAPLHLGPPFIASNGTLLPASTYPPEALALHFAPQMQAIALRCCRAYAS
jgi:hypothetical protein